MSRKKTIGIILLAGIAITAWYIYKEYNRTNKDLQKVKPDYSLTAMALIKDYETGDSAAAKKYNGSIIEVYGYVKKVDKDEAGYYTIVLGDSSSLSSVRCAVDTNYNDNAARVVPGSSVTVRGACTGYNKDEMGLGSDVILNRAVTIKKE